MNAINFSILYTQESSLYIGTNHEVIRMPAQHCKRHRTKQACLDAMDPYCGWNELKLECSPPPNDDPLTNYWAQLPLDCPSFTHPGKYIIFLLLFINSSCWNVYKWDGLALNLLEIRDAPSFLIIFANLCLLFSIDLKYNHSPHPLK